MTERTAVDTFLAACTAVGVEPNHVDANRLAPAITVSLGAEAWGEAARLAREAGLRWSAFWANPIDDGCEAFCLLEGGGKYLLLRTFTQANQPLPSQAPVFPSADRPERHAHDLTGIVFSGAPDSRRWTRHQAWTENCYPLRQDFSLLPDALGPTPPDSSYPFIEAQGAGVVEIPVGPVHAGIIEPGHFRFQAVGETVLNLEQRLGYVHKGIEKIAVGRDAHGLARLAARISGDSCVAHAWAACQALERAIGIDVPPRALWLRAVLAERERVANHLGDIGTICNDVGFSFAHYQLGRIKEEFLRENRAAFSHRLLMDRIVPGGVMVDLDSAQIEQMTENASVLRHAAAQLIATIEDCESLEDRLMTTGRLNPAHAELLGVVGYVGKASGVSFDVRRDSPYPPYNQLDVPVASYRAGDVAARAKVRAEEIDGSLRLIEELLRTLPEGAVCAAWPPAAQNSNEGLGIVEGWRGEIVTYVNLDRHGRVARFFPRDPSWLSWPALEMLIQNNIVPDFPVCNKSINGSYSGHDL